MKSILFTIAIILGFLGAPAFAFDEAKDAHYQAALTAAKADPKSANWLDLRIAYAESSSFSVFNDDENKPLLIKAYRSKDWKNVLVYAQKMIDREYVNGLAHALASSAYKNLGDQEKSDQEYQIAEGIFKSMQSGDGLSFEHAFNVISVDEEYYLMFWMGRSVVKQALAHNNGHSYDILTTKGDDDKSVEYYFLIDRVLEAEMSLFK